MRSFINAIFSLLSSSLEPYRSQNMYTPQMQPNAQVSGRTVEEQLEGDDRVNKKPWYSSAGSANASYCHHKRTASTGSTEYWVWRGPEGNDPDLDESTIPPTFEPSSPISLSEISKDSVTYLEADKIETQPRLDPIARCVTPSMSDGVPNLTLDTSTMITATGTDDLDTFSTSSSEPPPTPDLPSDSFSPLLRASRLALDADASRKTSRFGMATATPTTAGEEYRPLFGLGIFDISRKEDPFHAFDGLGIVRIQSSPWRPRQKSKTSPVKHGDDFSDEHGDGEQDDAQQYSQHISETFLHDLEAFFFVRDFTPSSSTPLSFSNHCNGNEHDGGSTFDIIIEEPATESGEGNSSPMTASTIPLPVPSTGNGSCLPSYTSTPASKNLAKRIRNALSLTPRRAARPPSDLCAIGSSTSSTQATSRSLTMSTPTSMSAPSTANSSYALTPSSSSFSSSSSSSSSTSFGIPTSSSGSKSAFVRRTCSALTLSRHDTRSSSRTRHHRGANTVSPSASARNLTVSVSMGPSPSRNIKSKGNENGVVALGLGDRSLQSHSVRDLSVVGTISSDLKRKMSVSLSRSGSSTSFGPGSGVRV